MEALEGYTGKAVTVLTEKIDGTISMTAELGQNTANLFRQHSNEIARLGRQIEEITAEIRRIKGDG